MRYSYKNLNHRSVLVHSVDEVCILLHHKVPLDLERRTQLLSLHRELLREHGELLHDIRPLVGLLVGAVKSLLERSGGFYQRRTWVLNSFMTYLNGCHQFVLIWPVTKICYCFGRTSALIWKGNLIWIEVHNTRCSKSYLQCAFCSKIVLICPACLLAALFPHPLQLLVSSEIKLNLSH